MNTLFECLICVFLAVMIILIGAIVDTLKKMAKTKETALRLKHTRIYEATAVFESNGSKHKIVYCFDNFEQLTAFTKSYVPPYGQLIDIAWKELGE